MRMQSQKSQRPRRVQLVVDLVVRQRLRKL
jgi:hypothetical protein